MLVAGYDDTQIANAAIIGDVARAWGLGDRGALLGVMCAMGESSLRNIDYGDWETSGVRNPDGTPTTSIGLFQQQASWGSVPDRMDPVYAAWKFFDALAKVRGWRDMAPTIAIHRVQINADPNHYAKYESAGRAVLAAIPDLRTRGIIMADPFDIIEVPWQPGHYARRALIDAVARAGKPRGNSWGRLKGEQQRAWDRYQNGTGSPADDPNRPNLFPLAHVRFIAVDVDATAENVRRLLSVGLVRPYDYEPWHFQLPGDVRKWPLVDAIPAATTSKPFEEDDSMSAADVAELKAHINSQFSNFLQVPGAGYGYPQSTEQKVDALAAAVARVASGQILFSPDAPYYLGPSIANAAREGNDTAPVVQVTEEAVIQAIAPLLPEHVGALSIADLDRLITAASAERARREQPTAP